MTVPVLGPQLGGCNVPKCASWMRRRGTLNLGEAVLIAEYLMGVRSTDLAMVDLCSESTV